MITPDREAEILGEYTESLLDAERALDFAQKEVDTLREIVSGLRRRVGDSAAASEPEPPELARPTGLDPDAELLAVYLMLPDGRTVKIENDGNPIPTYRGRPTLPFVLQGILRTTGPADLDTVLEALRHVSDYEDAMPSRNSVNTRLNEMVSEGKLGRDGRLYRVVIDHRPSHSSSGSGVLPVTAEGQGATPDGELSRSSSSGALVLVNAGGAPGVAHRAGD